MQIDAGHSLSAKKKSVGTLAQNRSSREQNSPATICSVIDKGKHLLYQWEKDLKARVRIDRKRLPKSGVLPKAKINFDHFSSGVYVRETLSQPQAGP